jgi:hypothetical protein
MGWKDQVRFLAVKDFSLLHSIQTNSGVHSASDPMGTEGSPREGGIKLQGHVADHSHPSSAKAKKSGAITPLFHMSSWHSA